jgi:hypothetical protein
MKSNDMLNLSKEALVAIANAKADDPHRLMKQSAKRQTAAVMAVIRPTPQQSDDIGDCKAIVANLEAQLEQQHKSHSRSFRPGQSFGAECQRSLNSIAKLSTQLYMARGRLEQLEQSAADRRA